MKATPCMKSDPNDKKVTCGYPVNHAGKCSWGNIGTTPVSALSFEALVSLVITEAQLKHDGHYSILAFTTCYSGCYGTPWENGEIRSLKKFKSLRELLESMASSAHLHILPEVKSDKMSLAIDREKARLDKEEGAPLAESRVKHIYETIAGVELTVDGLLSIVEVLLQVAPLGGAMIALPNTVTKNPKFSVLLSSERIKSYIADSEKRSDRLQELADAFNSPMTGVRN